MEVRKVPEPRKSVLTRVAMRNSANRPDAMLTLAVVAFVVCVVKFLLAGVSLAVGDYSLGFGDADSGAIAALLTPTLGAYVARRYTAAAHGRRRKREIDAE